MTHYAIGDIQGCYQELMQLVAKLDFNHSVDTLYLVGDLVNRGPESLKVLQWVYDYQDSVVTVLGNHDIFLLGRYAKVLDAAADETLADILNCAAAAKLIDFLRSRPLILHDDKHILVHAGIHPMLDFKQLVTLNECVMHYLQAPDYGEFIRLMFGNKPNIWRDDLSLLKQMKFMINACTRMRFLSKTTRALDYTYKGNIANCTADLIPWFSVAFHQSVTKRVLFGHWAALGLVWQERYVGLDTGCAWGRTLTALNLATEEIIQVTAQKP